MYFSLSTAFAPPVDSLVAIPDTNMPIVNLTWIIPYPQIPPDSYELTFTATKLSGVPLAEGSETEMMDFFDNETSSFGDGRTFTVTDLLFYSHYQFELVAFVPLPSGITHTAPSLADSIEHAVSLATLCAPSPS